MNRKLEIRSPKYETIPNIECSNSPLRKGNLDEKTGMSNRNRRNGRPIFSWGQVLEEENREMVCLAIRKWNAHSRTPTRQGALLSRLWIFPSLAATRILSGGCRHFFGLSGSNGFLPLWYSFPTSMRKLSGIQQEKWAKGLLVEEREERLAPR